MDNTLRLVVGMLLAPKSTDPEGEESRWFLLLGD
jgi:hypothetical protein